MDVVLLVDKSSSVNAFPNFNRWENTKVFVKCIAEALYNTQDMIHIALVVYDSEATILMHLSSSSERERLKIIDTVVANGETSTSNGIQAVMRSIFTGSGGDRVGAPVSRISGFNFLFMVILV